MKISFIGDILSHTAILESCKSGDSYDFSTLIQVEHLLKDSDYVVANMEFALRLSDEIKFEGDKSLRWTKNVQKLYPYVVISKVGMPILISAPTAFSDYVIDKLHINQVLLANNHSLDNGVNCFNLALDYYQNKSLDINGLYNTGGLIKTICGKKVGFYNYTKYIKLVPNNNSKAILQFDYKKEDLVKLRNEVDYLFVLPHWGTEYSAETTAVQSIALDEFNSIGADRVIGAHSHVVSKTSLGNFMSGRIDARSRLGVIHHVIIDDDKITDEYDYVWSAFRGTCMTNACVVAVQDVLDGKVEMSEEETTTMTAMYNKYKLK